jgi:hypothetical protein
MQTVKTPQPSHELVGRARHLHISIAEDRYIGLVLEGLRRRCKDEEQSEGCVRLQAPPTRTTYDNSRVDFSEEHTRRTINQRDANLRQQIQWLQQQSDGLISARIVFLVGPLLTTWVYRAHALDQIEVTSPI